MLKTRAALMNAQKVSFADRVIVAEPEEGNEDYEGRLGVVLEELKPDGRGRRLRVALEGESFTPLFYLHECVVQKDRVERLPGETKVVEVVKPREPSRTEALELAMQVLGGELSRIKGRHKG